jgi:hypothetical protein
MQRTPEDDARFEQLRERLNEIDAMQARLDEERTAIEQLLGLIDRPPWAPRTAWDLD